MNSFQDHQAQSKIKIRLHRFGVDVLPMNKGEILSEQVIYQNGCFKRVRRWISGIFPERGTIHWGYTGWETIEELDLITPMGKFTVLPAVQEIKTA